MKLDKRRVVYLVLAFVLVLGISVVALAEGEGAFSGAFMQIKNDTLDMLAELAPIAIGVFAVMYTWRMAKKFFNNIAK